MWQLKDEFSMGTGSYSDKRYSNKHYSDSFSFSKNSNLCDQNTST